MLLQSRLQFRKQVLNLGLIRSGSFTAEPAYTLIDGTNRKHGVKLSWVRVGREYGGKRREKAVDPVRTVQSPLNVQVRDFLYVDDTRRALSY